MRDILFLSVMLTMVPLALRFPVVGVMGWAWTALLSPNDWLYSYMSVVPFNKLFAGATLIAMALSARQLRFRMSPALWLLVCSLVVGTISAVFAIDQGDPGWRLYWQFVKIITFAFVISAVVRTRLDIHALLLAVALGMGFVGLSEGLFYLVSGGGHKIIGNPSVGDNNQLAVALLMVLPVVLYLARQAEVRLVKLVGYAAAACILTAIIGTFSRGGLVGLVALAGFMVAGSRRKLAGFMIIVIMGLVVVLVAPDTWYHRMDTITDASQDGSFMGRVVAWKISTMIALARPLFGGGFHAVQHAFAWDYYGSSMAMLDFIPTPPPTSFPRAAHSIYFETLGDLGFIGLSLFLSLMLLIYRNARAVRRLARNRPELSWAADLGFTLQASLVGYMVAGAAVSVSYVDFFYILVALSVVLRGLVVAETRSPVLAARVPMRAGAAGLRPIGSPALRWGVPPEAR
jgi:probable O-glycosylation ligase (exosortase A-associated)